MVGQRLAHYDITEHLGSGGMGDVYRATDTRLGRNVALKFLREDVAADPGRVARFRQEAKALAALNHPNIAAIHGHEESEGRAFLVMEFVPGQTLDERLDGRPLPLSESIRLALQIIEALEAAHGSGIVHRDLKPANIKITPDGRVKVLDFGLAKVAAGDGTSSTGGGHDAATVTLPSTRTGVILGTPAYMSPEQANGLPVDGRADIFAFGCVLFEMLTGRRAFAGSSVADVVSRVLQREPDWTLLPSDVPSAISRLLRLCLEKDPRRRRQSAGDVRVDLEGATGEPTAPSGVNSWRPLHVVAVAGGLVALTAVAVWTALRDRDAPAPLAMEISTPHTIDPMHFAVSPDGASLVFAAPGPSDGRGLLYVRPLNAFESRPLRGTDGAQSPFWSPDSRSIGYFANRKLYRVDVAGGSPQALAPAANPQGGAWAKDGTILFAPTTVSPLFRVPAESGGKPVAATVLHSPAQSNHRAPSFLPDGRRFLFYAVAAQLADSVPDDSGIYLGSLDGGTPKRLTAVASAAEFFPPDRIMFVQDGKLVARRIDVTRGELSGDPETVGEPVRWFSVSATGFVAYRSGNAAPRQGTWFDRSGNALPTGEDFNAPALSRDQRFLAYDRTVGQNRDVWILDRVRGDSNPLTRHPAIDGHPVWSPDDSQIAFHSQRNGTFDIWKKPSGGGAEELVVNGPANDWPLDWSRDGRFLLFQRTDENYVSSDLLAIPMTGSERTPIVIANSEFEERMGSFSPDGRWVAYETDEPGRPEVVIKAFPRPGGTTRVSTDGGATPRWNADGTEIYFIAPDGTVMAATVSYAASTLTVGKPTVLFPTHIAGQVFTFQYVVSRDGRFLVGSRQVEQASAPPIRLILNWKP